jgi:predicted phosphodiesterase
MRTVVISDLHLGGGPRAWLHRPEVRARLTDFLRGADRLVLLGDIIELRHAAARVALDAAADVLPGLVAALGDGAEVIIVFGNHDHALGLSWELRRSASPEHPPLALEEPVDWRDGEPLAVLAEQLAGRGVTVRAAYPGVWLREDIYAHHGHYLDRHTTVPFFERLGAAVLGRMQKIPTSGRATVTDYENVLAPIYGFMYPLAQGSGPAVDGSEGPSARAWRQLRFGRGPRRWAALAGARAAIATLNRTGLGPLSAAPLSGSLDGAELPAFATVLSALEVRARWAIFGHTHRAGPLPGDLGHRWSTPDGIRMLNSGSWVLDELFIGPEGPGDSPYRPGWAVEIVGEEDPRLVNLLGALTSHPPRRGGPLGVQPR